ncbi:MAG: cobalamin biosynthesis protein CobU [Christensenellales bacterium]|jgi:adenosylcobinamide kinase/adenosylcobinamide-phosphate guanylyltransferase
MELIIGGAYQGKTEYASGLFGITSLHTCAEDADVLDFSHAAICHIERFCLACVRSGKSARAYFEENRDQWQDKVLIADDISCGVVPMDAEMRAWREETGRLLAYLAGEAARVHRVFLGIGQVIK